VFATTQASPTAFGAAPHEVAELQQVPLEKVVPVLTTCTPPLWQTPDAHWASRRPPQPFEMLNAHAPGLLVCHSAALSGSALQHVAATQTFWLFCASLRQPCVHVRPHVRSNAPHAPLSALAAGQLSGSQQPGGGAPAGSKQTSSFNASAPSAQLAAVQVTVAPVMHASATVWHMLLPAQAVFAVVQQ